MVMKKSFSGIALSSLFLAGCFSDAEDPDQGGISTVQVSGVALDAYIAGATVYADLNNNGKRDAFEPKAFTDANGYFSVGPNGEDYCTVGPARYCLRVPASHTHARLRVSGGFDLLTGEMFSGEMSRKIHIPTSDSTAINAITPFTSLIESTVSGENNYWSNFDAEQAITAYSIHQSLLAVARRLSEEFEHNGNGQTTVHSIHQALQKALLDNLSWGASSDTLQVQADWNYLDQVAFENIIQDALDQLNQTSSQVSTLASLVLSVNNTLNSANPACPEGDQSLTGRETTAATIKGTYALWLALDGLNSLSTNIRDGFLATLDALYCENEYAQNHLDFHVVEELITNYAGGSGALDLDAARFVGDLSEVANSKISLNSKDFATTAAFAFNDDGTFSLTAQSGGELDFGEFGECEEGEPCDLTISGDWQQVGDNQIILVLSAFGGAFERSASLRLGAGTDGSTLWVFAFDYNGKRASYTSTTGFEPQQP